MSRRWNHALISLVLLFATGCASLHVPIPRLFGPSKHNAATTRIPRKGELPGLVGRVQQVRVSSGDTLLDIARGADVGYQQVQDANPQVDAWVPVVQGLQKTVSDTASSVSSLKSCSGDLARFAKAVDSYINWGGFKPSFSSYSCPSY